MGKRRKNSSTPNNSAVDDEDNDDPSIADVYKLMVQQGKQLAEMNTSTKSLKEELERMNEVLQANVKEVAVVKADTTKLQSDVSVINSDIHELRQELLVNNIVVSGLKIDKECGLRENFRNLTSLLGMELSDAEISDIFMVQRKAGPVLIVKLVNTKTKLDLMTAVRIKSKVAGSAEAPNPVKDVYLNDHLSNYYEHLWFKARLLKKKANFAGVWTMLGKIYMRKLEGGKQIRIRTLENLQEQYKIHGLEI
jgi:hypothetical protein